MLADVTNGNGARINEKGLAYCLYAEGQKGAEIAPFLFFSLKNIF